MPLSEIEPRGSQAGSAVANFVLLAAPLALLTVTVITISLSSFCALVIRDSAIEGARYAALADQDSSSGCERAKLLATKAIGQLASIEASCNSSESGYEIVRLRASYRISGLLITDRQLMSVGVAPREN